MKAGEGEIFSKRMAREPIICEDALKPLMADKVEAIHISDLPLQSAGTSHKGVAASGSGKAGKEGCFGAEQLDADSSVVARGEEVVGKGEAAASPFF